MGALPLSLSPPARLKLSKSLQMHLYLSRAGPGTSGALVRR